MSSLIYLIPIALGLGLTGLAAFLWSLKNGQYEDLEGAAERILIDEDVPIPPICEKPAERRHTQHGRDAEPARTHHPSYARSEHVASHSDDGEA